MEVTSINSVDRLEAVPKERPHDTAEKAQAYTGVGPYSNSDNPTVEVVNDQLLSGEDHIDATTLILQYEPRIPGVDVRA